MKKIIRNFLNKRNYEIIKQPYIGDKYRNLSKDKNEYYCETPIGNYYLPIQFEVDAVASTLVRGKFFEPEIIEVAKKYIKKGTAVLDLGANFGQMSIEFSKLVGESGKIYSFEEAINRKLSQIASIHSRLFKDVLQVVEIFHY